MKPFIKTMAAKISNLEMANEFVDACYEKLKPEGIRKFSVLLVLEEAFVNICHYAYPDDEGDVEIVCECENGSFVLEIADRGSAFDVLSLPEPDITLDVEKRPVGGLGIFLIRTLSSSSYRRLDGKNILRMEFSSENPC